MPKTAKSGRSKTTKYKGISRINQPGRHGVGWYARVTHAGTTYSKYFADNAHGGTDAALKKALNWRNTKEKDLGKPRTDRVVPPVSRRSSTGIPGVYKMGNHYVVAWSPRAGELSREFVSIKKHGKDEALRKAVELRQKREKEVYGRVLSSGLSGKGKKSSKKKAKRK